MSVTPTVPSSLAAVRGVPRLILRGEGLALLIAAAAAYGQFGFSWPLFAALFLAPDLTFLAYLAGPRVGAVAYNALHATMLPLGVGAVSFAGHWSLGEAVALVWLAHVGFDRALGYGLKYGASFNDTHLGRIGRSA